MNDLYKQWIQTEMEGLYGANLIQEMTDIIGFYSVYDGPGQDWSVNTADDQKFVPTKCITNFVKKLINDESRFMASRAPELKLQGEDRDEKALEALEDFILKTLTANRWRKRLLSATRDAFIGRRVALKLSGGPGKPLRILFAPSLEFVYDVDPEDPDRVSKVIFFYSVTPASVTDKEKQRIWKQKYWMDAGRCYLNEGLYDGYGKPVKETYTKFDTKLDFVPVRIIINGGLTGDMSGESDVEAITHSQAAYNHMRSDDIDAMKYNMFPQKYIVDASPESVDSVVIAPNALIDLQSDSSQDGKQAQAGVLETSFNYDPRLEHALDRLRDDMHELLSVPRISTDMLKGIGTSGKAMRAMYWSLICRCEEKWAEGWDDAITWMVESMLKMAKVYGIAALPEVEYDLKIEHLYPILDDEEDERVRDLSEVAQMARSRKSYIEKWQQGEDADGELQQIKAEQDLTRDDFSTALREELTT